VPAFLVSARVVCGSPHDVDRRAGRTEAKSERRTGFERQRLPSLAWLNASSL
jgi:hypothetical protein